MLSDEKALSSELRAWAEQAEASKAADVEAALAEAKENEAWALRTEALLARSNVCLRALESEELPRLRALAESNEMWARNVEATLSVERALSSELRAWAQEAESAKAAEVEAARTLAKENEAWALRTEALLAQERRCHSPSSMQVSGVDEA
jgi:hypothetical protein